MGRLKKGRAGPPPLQRVRNAIAGGAGAKVASPLELKQKGLATFKPKQKKPKPQKPRKVKPVEGDEGVTPTSTTTAVEDGDVEEEKVEVVVEEEADTAMDTAPLNQDGEDNGKEEETTSPTTTIPSFPGTTTTSDDPPPPFPFPFPPTSHILLLGEGDLSLSTTLHKTHHCTNLLPTVLDTQPELFTKYHPQASAHVAHLAAHNIHPLYSIDATKLHLAPRIRKYPGGGFDAVVFMFPHVGGKTSDQARQVRANQQMLLGMFASVKGVVKKAAKGEKGGVLAVALFDGEPYHTWDIRALARAHGWRVQRSGKLDWEAFKGYKHARTLGNVRRKSTTTATTTTAGGGGGGGGGAEDTPTEEEKIERGGWKGEERPAKLWIFEKDDGKKLNAPGKKKKKRKGNDPDGSSSSESDSEGERAAIAKRRKQGMAALKAQVRT